MGIFIKLTGIAPSVAFNLAVPTLFALTAAAPSRWSTTWRRASPAAPGPFWRQGIGAGLAGNLFVVVIGNLDAMGQVLRRLAEQTQTPFQARFPACKGSCAPCPGRFHLLTTGGRLSGFDLVGAQPRCCLGRSTSSPFWSSSLPICTRT
ncbi:DUF2298 domain-containing protein [Candidatus Amarolinea dominans]|uniref:DUF2298 domain-containing protein n=1 Tax=Candidatus Amarolinea dominans TaxID=3140696 RepID=UPI00313565E0|nr:hypothetical protein [Anaerolineae bacterium]